MKKIFMFAGQGSQSYHMGKELFENNTCFKQHMQALDQVVSREFGYSVIQQLFSDNNKRSDIFDHLPLTHPAIFMVEYSMAQCLIEKGITADMVLGASLGEVAAAVVSGVLDAEDAVCLVCKQAQLFQSKSVDGGMLAILADIALFDQEPVIYSNSEIAAINFTGNFIVAGNNTGLDKIQHYLSEKAITFLRLPVQQAFHTSLLDYVEGEFNRISEQFSYRQPAIPFYSCAATQQIDRFDAGHIWSVYQSPIRLFETVGKLEKSGAYCYVDLGPGGTMANMVKYNSEYTGASKVYPIMTPFGRELKGLEKVFEELSA